MERRRALAISAATAATTLGAVAAIAANFGLLGFGQPGAGPAGRLNAGQVTGSADPAALPAAAETPLPAGNPAPRVTVRYEDLYLPAPAAPAATGVDPATTAASDCGPPVAGDAGREPYASTGDDDEGRHEHDDGDERSDRHEDEDHDGHSHGDEEDD